MTKNNIKKLRDKWGITQSELAKMLDVSIPTISYWERNEKQPRMDKAQKLAEIFETNTAYLLGISQVANLEEIESSIQELREEDFEYGIDVAVSLKSKNEYEIVSSLQYLTDSQLHQTKNIVEKFRKDNNVDDLKE